MRVLLRIVRLEARLLLGDRAVWLMLLVFSISVVFAIWNGARVISQRERTIVEFTTQERENLARTRELAIRLTSERQKGNEPAVYWNATRPATATFYTELSAVLPLYPLSALALGDVDIVPGAFRSIDAGRTVPESVPSAPQIANPLTSLLGAIDLHFVVVYLIPLAVLSLCYGVTAERDSGVLPLLMSQPVTLQALVAAKFLCRVGIFVLVSGTVIVGALALFRPDVFGPGWRAPLAEWCGAALVYSLFWFAMAALVAARGSSTMTTGIVLGSLWLLWVFVVPPVMIVVARVVRPVPSQVIVVNAKREAVIRAGGHRLLELEQELAVPGSSSNRQIEAYFRDHPEYDAARLSSDDRYRMVFFLKMAEADRLASSTENHWAAARDAQETLIERLRFASPASLLSATLVDVSGTGRPRYDDFLTQVDAHRRVWLDWVVAKYADARRLDGSDYDRLPQFVYREEPSSKVRTRALTNVGVLLGFTGMLLVSASALLRRYPVVG